MKRVMIHGRSRSGTTITRKILSNHYEIQIMEERRIYHNIEQILNTENRLYNGNSKYFGDKTGTPKIQNFKQLIPFKINYIFIYRDGRDVVSSGFRLVDKYGESKKKKLWRGTNTYENSYDWAKLVGLGLIAYKKFKPHLKLRFEDYVEFPGKNAELISDFLKIDKKAMIESEYKMIKSTKSHIGDYPLWIPDWKESFHPKAIKMLKEIKYI